MSWIECIDIGRRNTRAYLLDDETGFAQPVSDQSQSRFALPQGFAPEFAPAGASASCILIGSSGIAAGNAAALLAGQTGEPPPLWLHSISENGPTSVSIDGTARTIYPDFILRALILRALDDFRAHSDEKAEKTLFALRSDASAHHRCSIAHACRGVREAKFIDSSLIWYAGSEEYGRHEMIAVMDIGFGSTSVALIEHRGTSIRISRCASDRELGALAIQRDLRGLHSHAWPDWMPVAPTREDAVELTLNALNAMSKIQPLRTARGAPYLTTTVAYQGFADQVARKLLSLVDEAVPREKRHCATPERIIGIGSILQSPFGKELARALRTLNGAWSGLSDPASAIGLGLARIISEADSNTMSFGTDGAADTIMTQDVELPGAVNDFGL